MSQLPPAGNHSDNTLAYRAAPRYSALAVAALVLGVSSIPLICVMGIGMPIGLVAFVLGIVARGQIDRNPDRLTGKGFAISGMWTGLIGGVFGTLLMSISIGSTGKASEMSNRSVCAANIRGIMQAVVIYSADNGDSYPMLSPAGYGLATASRGAPSITRNFWYLVQTGAMVPKQFVCKSDPAPTVAASLTTPAGVPFENFNDGKVLSDFSYSYSFAYPWTAAPRTALNGKVIPAGSVAEWWRNSMDASMVLMADMAPLQGTGNPAATPGDGGSRVANSFNHYRDGQNVAFGDAHAEFVRSANVGDHKDNIYAGSKGVPNEIGVQTAGMVPDIGDGGGPRNWDVCLVPAADGGTGVRK